MRRPTAILAVSAATVLLPTFASAQTPPPSTSTSPDPTGDAAPFACIDGPGGFECAQNGQSIDKIDITRVTAVQDDDVTITLDLVGRPVVESDDGYISYTASVQNDPDAAEATRFISFNILDQGAGPQAMIATRSGSDAEQNPPACRDSTFAIDRTNGGSVTFVISADCLDFVGGMPVVWPGASSEWSSPGDTAAADQIGFPGPDPTFGPEARALAGRIAGDTRFQTAVRVSQRQFPDGADTVYLARAFDPLVDALAGGMVTDGPVLLVPADGNVPDTVTTEIARIDPDTVIALGGASAIPSATLTKAADGRQTSRLAGTDRYTTAVRVSERQFPDGADTVYLARGIGNLVDALAGGTLTDGPVLLVPPSGNVPDTVTAEIDRIDPDTVIALGGPAAITQQVLDAAADGRQTSRLAGTDRYGTALAVARAAHPNPDTVYLARALDPLVDALAGGMVTDGPIVLVPADGTLPPAVTDYLASLDDTTGLVVLGGTGAITDTVLGYATRAAITGG